MKLPFTKQKPRAEMTEAELEAGIARWDKVLDIRPKLSPFFAGTAIPVTAAAQLALVISAGAITGFAAFGGLAIGIAYFVGGAYACKGVLSHALHQRNAMTDVYNTKVTVRIAAEQENERLRKIKAGEDFNAAVDAGLPLEADIIIKRALKLKRTEPPKQHGFARVKDFFDPRL